MDLGLCCQANLAPNNERLGELKMVRQFSLSSNIALCNLRRFSYGARNSIPIFVDPPAQINIEFTEDETLIGSRHARVYRDGDNNLNRIYK